MDNVDSDAEPNGLRDAAAASESLVTNQADSDGQRIQEEILAQLKKMSHRLDTVEQQISSTAQDPGQASTSSSGPGKLSTHSDFLDHSKSTPCKKSKKSKKFVPPVESSESSSDESVSPSLPLLKSQSMQTKVDRRIRELNGCSHVSGNECSAKYKSKRGGNVDVSVKNKVLWPHEAILGGFNRQRVTYDQLSLTQWVQGFCKNILEEKSSHRRDTMVSYLGDLMEDATDFTWQGAKAAHAVLMCEMERGSVKWEDTDRIDRIRRAHAQKHAPARGGWAKLSDPGKKPWFCKNFQSGNCTHSRDHEFNGKLQKHICAFCLMGGKQLGHAEKDCIFKKQNPKKDQAAAHH